MHLLKLPAPVLALILSALAEGMFFLITRLFGITGYLHFTALQDLWYRFFMWFHMPAAISSERLAHAHFVSHDVGMGLVILIAVFQWWLILSAAIWIFRYSRRRHERAA